MKLEILYEDAYLIVCIKPPAVPSQKDPTGDLDMLSMIKSHLMAQYPKAKEPYVGLIHRLDRPVGGVMVFGKTKEATAALSKQMQSDLFKKKYLTVLCGVPEIKSGRLEHFLFRVASKNVSKVVSEDKQGAKKALLDYELIDTFESSEYGSLSLVNVSLLTGRHHQIRVQWSAEGHPIWGDTKYNTRFSNDGHWYQIALWAYDIKFLHPKSKENMHFVSMPNDIIPFSLFEKNFKIVEVTNEIRS